jgi:hypothetical protein
VRYPTPVVQAKSCRDQTTPTPKVRKEEYLMDEKVISVTKKVIGDTLYIIESAVSSTAKETAYDKLKRMILNDTVSLETKKAS